MQFPPGFSVRDAEPAEFCTYSEEHRRTMFPNTIDVDHMGVVPEHLREARCDRITHRASQYRRRWFILYEQTVVVYPNPAESVLTISGLSGAASFTVTDVLARPLLTGTTSGDIDITSLARGSYVLTLMQGGEARSVRFVKE